MEGKNLWVEQYIGYMKKKEWSNCVLTSAWLLFQIINSVLLSSDKGEELYEIKATLLCWKLPERAAFHLIFFIKFSYEPNDVKAVHLFSAAKLFVGSFEFFMTNCSKHFPNPFFLKRKLLSLLLARREHLFLVESSENYKVLNISVLLYFSFMSIPV